MAHEESRDETMGAKFDPRKIDRLLAPERYARLHPDELLRDLGLASGDTFADIGSGPGFFTVPAAEIVGPTGKVYAVEVQPPMIAALMMRVADLGLHQIEIVKAEETEAPLPHQRIDLALFAFVLHEMPARAMYLQRLRAALRPGNGRIAILEWEKRPTEGGPPLANRIAHDELADDLRCAGYTVKEERAMAPDQYILIAAPVLGESHFLR
jgi:ubiquinone/menaquinone biosynthesis C-methylase UbiE